MSQIYLTSDIHLFHKAVQYLRGYDSDVEQYDALREAFAHVTKRDTVWILGDVNLSRLEGTLKIISQLNGTKRLILGNHDAPHPVNSKKSSASIGSRYIPTFASIGIADSIYFKDQQFLLSHFPYDGEGPNREKLGLQERYSQWRLKDMGIPLIHGHTHSHEKYSESKSSTPQFHVGLDAYPKLAKLSDIYERYQEVKQNGTN